MNQLDLEIIDPSGEGGARRVAELRAMGFVADDLPLATGRRELADLATHLAGVRARFDLGGHAVSADRLSAALEGLISSEAPSVPRAAIASLLRATPLVIDLATLINETAPYARDPSLVDRESRWIADGEAKKLYAYVGPSAHRLLSKTRLVGLVPFAVADALQRLRIRGMGASVAASTYDLLVSLGAEDLVFADAGTLDPSNSSRMPAGVGDFRNCGRSKALVLARTLRGRNPYARIVGIPGMVVPGGKATGPHDVSFDEFVADADLVIEVVDDARVKLGVRLEMERKFPDTLLGFIADLGNAPFSAIERPRDKKHFHCGLPSDEIERMLSRLGKVTSPTEARDEALRSVYRIIERDFPADHSLEFLFARLGIVPYWSQTPMAARESAAIFAKLLSLQVQKIDVVGKNVAITETPTYTMAPISAEDEATLRRVCNEVFSIDRG